MKLNKFVMVCLIVAATGAVIGGIGFLLGGRVYGLSLGGKGVVVSSNGGNIGSDIEYVKENKNLEAFKSLDLDVAFSDIQIKEADHFGIEYCVRKDCPVTEELQGDTMVIKQNRPKGMIASFSVSGISYGNLAKEYITISVPKGEKFSTIKLHNESGDITLGDLVADELTIEDAFGSIEAQKLAAGTTDFILESGDVTVDEMQTAHMTIKDSFGKAAIGKLETTDADFKFESGDIKIDEIKAEQLTVKNTFGQVLLGDADVANKVSINVESGDIEFDQLTSDDVELYTTFGYVDGKKATVGNILMDLESGDCSIDDILADTVDVKDKFGAVKLGLREGAETYSIDAKTTFGSVTVNGEDMGEKYRDKSSDSKKQLVLNCESGDIELSDVE
ncbi:MAG: DUF4097 family beta strand repeat-containing protein [bacterium]|nr:DUF4097 family beta strand repeat-containing protein [bacterium]